MAAFTPLASPLQAAVSPYGRSAYRLVFALALTGLCLLAFHPPDVIIQTVLLAAGVILLGLPHGAYDGYDAVRALWRRGGVAWMAAYVALYAAIAAAVATGWLVAPTVTFVAFFIAAALHFGHEETEAIGLSPTTTRAFALGATAVFTPLAAHPSETAALLDVMSGTQSVFSPFLTAWVGVGGLLLAAGIALTRMRSTFATPHVRTVQLALLAGFVVLPPILAFVVYFCLWHSLRHMLDHVRRMPGHSAMRWRTYLGRLAPWWGGAVALLGAAFAFTPLWTNPTQGVQQVVFVGLTAFAVPHMLQPLVLRRCLPNASL